MFVPGSGVINYCVGPEPGRSDPDRILTSQIYRILTSQILGLLRLCGAPYLFLFLVIFPCSSLLSATGQVGGMHGAFIDDLYAFLRAYCIGSGEDML